MTPTKASLQRELRAMTEQAEIYEQSSQEHAQASEEKDEQLAWVRDRLRPILAYFGEQWIGDRVRKEYQELVQFAEGSADE